MVALRHWVKTHPTMSTKAYVALMGNPALDVLVQAPADVRAVWVAAVQELLVGAVWLDYGLDTSDEAQLEALVVALK